MNFAERFTRCRYYILRQKRLEEKVSEITRDSALSRVRIEPSEANIKSALLCTDADAIKPLVAEYLQGVIDNNRALVDRLHRTNLNAQYLLDYQNITRQNQDEAIKLQGLRGAYQRGLDTLNSQGLEGFLELLRETP